MSGLQDQIINRFRAHGLEVQDIRALLPRNGTWLRRPVSQIKQLAVHWDAMDRPHSYDSVARYISEAWYHINKDWNPPNGAHGDGLMYAWKIDNTGVVFITRDLEDVLWSVGDQNYVTASVCFDGNVGQSPTHEQIAAEQKVLDVLCYECPEFPATQSNVLGHQEVPGNSTACPGSFLASARSYRAEKNTHPEIYAWDYPPAPAPQPAPPPPAPVVAPPPAPVTAPVLSQPPAAAQTAAAVAPTPEQGKGGGTPTPAPVPIQHVAPAAPPADAIDLSHAPTSFAFPAPPVPHDHWEAFPEGEKVLFLEDTAYAHDLTGAKPPKGPLPAGTPVKAIGILTDGAKKYVVGRTNYAIQIEDFNAPEAPGPEVDTAAKADAMGELIRALGRLERSVSHLFNRGHS